MSLYKRADSTIYWCRFQVGGREIRRSTRRALRKEAEKVEACYRAEILDREQFGTGHTWEEAALAWVQAREHKRSADRDVEIITWLKPHLGGRRLDEISTSRLDEIREIKKAESSASTANRYLALVRSILRLAHENDMLPIVPKVRMYALEKPDPHWLTREQFDQLLERLPEHLKFLARFAVATGLRRTNITRLRWSQIDLKRRHAWIAGRDAKGKRALPVPLNREAMAVLAERRGKHEAWVFTYRGRPVTQVSTKAWRNAVTAIGHKGLRFHDLRHTWASWHAQAGTPLQILQELGGWRSAQLVQRYAHFAAEHLADFAENTARKPDQVRRRNRARLAK